MRAFFPSLMLLLLTASAPPIPTQGDSAPRIESLAVPLAPFDPARRRIGRLVFHGAWQWRSDQPAVGGLSALRSLRNGFIAISDDGAVLRFALGPGGAVANARLGQLPLGPGEHREKKDRDAESLAADEAGGRLWIGFEGANVIRRYDLATGRLTGTAAPPLMRHWPRNAGPEAMVRLADGRFIVFSEAGGAWSDRADALLFSGDPVAPGVVAAGFAYRPPAGYNITDAAVLPDGRLLLLHRRFTFGEGVSCVLAVADPSAIRVGGILESTEIARLAPPLTVDNMEGVALTREGRKTVVWLLSDDNFNPFQRTLLMKFTL